MKTAIVGYTGFVGSNICAFHKFDAYYNSKNIEAAFGTSPDLLVYCGVRAEMYLANKFPGQDLAIIENAINNIRRINPKFVVLISSIAVYDKPYDVTEATLIDKEKATAYGKNRRILEEWVEQTYPNSLILRLPGLFGINLKKNFIYDLINIIPSMLHESKYLELSSFSSIIKESYSLQDNGFYKCTAYGDDLPTLKKEFTSIGFTALNFTDSRGLFQYFNLQKLWGIIDMAIAKGIHLLNVAVEPVSSAEIYSAVNNGALFVNELDKPIPYFNVRTQYAEILGGTNGYLESKQSCLMEIKDFINSQI